MARSHLPTTAPASLATPPGGEPVPFELLVKRHGAELRRFIGRTVRSSADADDLCQETLLRAHYGYGRLERQADAQRRAWLFRIAANVCVDYLRKRRREPSVELADVASRQAGPDDVAIAQDELRRVRELMAHLPPRQREALVLRRLRGLDYAEVAQRMGGTAETARANVYQAIRRLRQALDSSRDNEEDHR